MRYPFVVLMLPALLFGCGPLTAKQQDKAVQSAEGCPADGCPTLAAPAGQYGDAAEHDGETANQKNATSKYVPEHDDAQDDASDFSPVQTPFQGELPTLTIDGVALAGNGCSDGTTAANISDDGQALTLLFADFVVDLSADALTGKDGIARASRRCLATLTLNVPHGYRLAVMTMDYRGYADLQTGVKATLRRSVAFGNQTPTWFSHTMQGELAEEFYRRDTLSLSTTAYSACGGSAALKIDVRASLAATTGATGLFALDSADGEITQKYALAWRRCTP